MSGSGVRSIAVAARGKGGVNLVRRAGAIGARYGLGPNRMEQRLDALLEIADRYECRPTLPITAAAAQRHPRVVNHYASRGIEFAVHGLHHVDHHALAPRDQVEQLRHAKRVLEASGTQVAGFRAPYLRWNDDTVRAIHANDFLYDSSEAISWPIDPARDTEDYRRVLGFCGAVPSEERTALPKLDGDLVRIPYCLPDDEAIVDRLHVTAPEEIALLWLSVFEATHERGELFTLGVHPERVEPCASGIDAVLNAARAARPSVWIARLDEIACWWRDRVQPSVEIHVRDDSQTDVIVTKPAGATILRGFEPPSGAPSEDGPIQIGWGHVGLRTERRPCIAVHPSSPTELTSFLREQGFIVEHAATGDAHHCFLKRDRFSRTDEQPLLAQLDLIDAPLLRLGRWPDGARSAIAITGDVDALTIWDYAYRIFGR